MSLGIGLGKSPRYPPEWSASSEHRLLRSSRNSRLENADPTPPISPATTSQNTKSARADCNLETNSAIVDLRLRLAAEPESRKSIGLGERIGEKIGEILPGFRYSAGALLRFAPCLAEELGSVEENRSPCSRQGNPQRWACGTCCAWKKGSTDQPGEARASSIDMRFVNGIIPSVQRS